MLGKGCLMMNGLFTSDRWGAVGDMDQLLLVFFLGTLIFGRILVNSDFCCGFPLRLSFSFDGVDCFDLPCGRLSAYLARISSIFGLGSGLIGFAGLTKILGKYSNMEDELFSFEFNLARPSCLD